MSFLQGGSECAAGSNPLAQLAKRPDVDTSLQSTIRNGHLGDQQQLHRSGAFGAQAQMSQHNQAMLDKFADPSNSLGMSGTAFEFQPLARELKNIQSQNINNDNTQNYMLNQQSHQHSGWTSEFNNNAGIINSPSQNTSGSSFNQPMMSMPGSMHSQGMPMQSMMRMRNIQMAQPMQQPMYMHQQREQQQQQQQQPVQSHDQQVDWEDSFKEIEQHVGSSADQFEVNKDESVFEGEMNPVVDPMFSATPNFNDKYHEEYQFEEKNEFLHNPNAYEIGCRLMEGGARLSEAALAFEAAVQEDRNHVDAWLKLGQVQIQNEKELSGITALENCLLVDGKNLTALMSLAISYVNEGYDNAAFKTFENWIEAKYPDIVSKARNENPNDVSDDRYSLNKRVTNLFLKAAQLSPSGVNVDADVQTGLGVLFYSMEEYDKTLDCFQAAIRCNPNDALSWNRLGASYANSNRPEQAIEAYSKALQLNPNFVRARYNLGVSFINMGMYKDAVDHLLTGLSMHEIESPDGDGMKVGDSDQSGNLIETLKRAFLAMDRRDLLENVRPGMNVAEFRRNFSV